MKLAAPIRKAMRSADPALLAALRVPASSIGAKRLVIKRSQAPAPAPAQGSGATAGPTPAAQNAPLAPKPTVQAQAKARRPARPVVVLRPQAGPQEAFLSSRADIVIYGGAAGGGKSFGLFLDTLRYMQHPGFGAVIFRRTFPEIKNEGGLWDSSQEVFGPLGFMPKESSTEWKHPDFHTSIKFSHMQHEKDRLSWQGSQIPYIGFDELTHFTRLQFFYMLSRNRSTCGVRPCIRATTNPDPDSWVAKFIAWWIDQDTGYPIPERDGVLRWFIRDGDEIVWNVDPSKLPVRKNPDGSIILPMSVTFIRSNVYDNKILLAKDPNYLSNLNSLPRYERLLLLGGNWKVRRNAGMLFQKDWFEIVEAAPASSRRVRYWDRAATEPTPDSDPDYTVGLRMSRTPDNIYYVEDVDRFRLTPKKVEDRIKTLASHEPQVHVWLEEDPGSAGKAEVAYLIRSLTGYNVHTNRVTQAKFTRALPASAQAEARNIKLVRGKWNEAFLDELEAFCDPDQLLDGEEAPAHDDQVDAFSGAFNVLNVQVNPRIR